MVTRTSQILVFIQAHRELSEDFTSEDIYQQMKKDRRPLLVYRYQMSQILGQLFKQGEIVRVGKRRSRKTRGPHHHIYRRRLERLDKIGVCPHDFIKILPLTTKARCVSCNRVAPAGVYQLIDAK